MTRDSEGQGPLLVPAMLALGDNVIFKETAFFSRGNVSLPAPDDVRQLGSTDPWRTLTPVSFPALNLLVKYGPRITIAEGQCMWAIRHLLPDVPVPEVYGWCIDQGQTFIYMQLIDGITLEDAWPELAIEGKYEVCLQLNRIMGDINQLRQDPADPFIGSINRQNIRDILFEGRGPAGTFSDVSSFHDWFANLSWPPGHDPTKFSGPWRAGLLEDVPIVFTDADLHCSNIIVSRKLSGMPNVTALIDWHQSGWYPASWEFCKTRYTEKATARGIDKWEIDFILEFLDSYCGGVSFEWFAMSS